MEKKKPIPTQEEIIFTRLLENRGVKVEPQHYDGYKHVDLFLPEFNLVIEIDGKWKAEDPIQALTNLHRDFGSAKKGRKTLRIPNSLVRSITKREEYADSLVNYLKQMQTHKQKIEAPVYPAFKPTKIFNKPVKKATVKKIEDPWFPNGLVRPPKPKNHMATFFIIVLIILSIIFISKQQAVQPQQQEIIQPEISQPLPPPEIPTTQSTKPEQGCINIIESPQMANETCNQYICPDFVISELVSLKIIANNYHQYCVLECFCESMGPGPSDWRRKCGYMDYNTKQDILKSGFIARGGEVSRECY